MAWLVRRTDLPDFFYNLDSETIIGRDLTSNIICHEVAISKKHALITISEDGSTVFLEDLGSANGTFIGENKVYPKTKYLLTENAFFSLACQNSEENSTFKYQLVWAEMQTISISDEEEEEEPETTSINTRKTVSFAPELVAPAKAPRKTKGRKKAKKNTPSSIPILKLTDEEKKLRKERLKNIAMAEKENRCPPTEKTAQNAPMYAKNTKKNRGTFLTDISTNDT